MESGKLCSEVYVKSVKDEKSPKKVDTPIDEAPFARLKLSHVLRSPETCDMFDLQGDFSRRYL
jgi:hypothetical protein